MGWNWPEVSNRLTVLVISQSIHFKCTKKKRVDIHYTNIVKHKTMTQKWSVHLLHRRPHHGNFVLGDWQSGHAPWRLTACSPWQLEESVPVVCKIPDAHECHAPRRKPTNPVHVTLKPTFGHGCYVFAQLRACQWSGISGSTFTSKSSKVVTATMWLMRVPSGKYEVICSRYTNCLP